MVGGMDKRWEFLRRRSPSCTASVGAYFGLTPSKYASGETDYTGHITKCGDKAVRALLCEAANVLLTRVGRNGGVAGAIADRSRTLAPARLEGPAGPTALSVRWLERQILAGSASQTLKELLATRAATTQADVRIDQGLLSGAATF